MKTAPFEMVFIIRGKMTVVSDTIVWVGKVGRNHAK